VSSLVNLGVITYLTQLLDSGFFHADPHPGNMLRTDDGKLAIIDFGLMTEITNDQKYGMIEAIAHLIQRDYSEIGQDFINLDFIPKGTDTTPIVPALTKVFDVALAGGGAKSINFQDLAADLAEITFEYPFRIPPYFALVIRAISVLEGIALVGNPNFAIIDEAYPYIARKLMTDKSPRLRKALRYMIYGKNNEFDVENVIDLLQALEKFTAIRDDGDGTAFKVDGIRGNKVVGSAGDFIGSQKVQVNNDDDDDIDEYTKERFQLTNSPGSSAVIKRSTSNDDNRMLIQETQNDERTVRDALRFFFSPKEGEVFREFMLEEIVSVLDAASRSAVLELIRTLNIGNIPLPSIIRAFTPELSDPERRMIQQITKFVQFLVGIDSNNNSNNDIRSFATTTRLRKLIPVLREYSPQLREFGILLVARLTEKAMSRGLTWATDQLLLLDSSPNNSNNNNNRLRFNQRSFIRR
jgi:aarF domain-containing kinase